MYDNEANGTTSKVIVKKNPSEDVWGPIKEQNEWRIHSNLETENSHKKKTIF